MNRDVHAGVVFETHYAMAADIQKRLDARAPNTYEARLRVTLDKRQSISC